MASYSDMREDDLLEIFDFNSYPKTVELNESNHEIDNHFISYDSVREVVGYLDHLNYNILGFCKAPYSHDHFCWAIVLENYENDYNIHWCHVSDECILQWRCSLTGEDYLDLLEKYNID